MRMDKIDLEVDVDGFGGPRSARLVSVLIDETETAAETAKFRENFILHQLK